MDCPYCGKGLTEGYIYGGSYGVNYAFKWLSASKEPTLAALELEAETIGEYGLFTQPKVKCQRCDHCKKIIIDLGDSIIRENE
ncbi:MAG: PF20097 family protein [Bacillota bacterium]